MSMHICCPPSAPLHTSASVKLTILAHSPACLPQRNVGIPVILFTCSTFPPASQFGRLDPCRRTSAAVFTTLTTQAAAHCARGLNDTRFLRPHHRVALNGSAYSRLCMYMCVCARRIVRAIICKFVVTYFSLAAGMPRGFVAFRSSLHTHIYIFYSIYIHIDLYTCLPYLYDAHFLIFVFFFTFLIFYAFLYTIRFCKFIKKFRCLHICAVAMAVARIVVALDVAIAIALLLLSWLLLRQFPSLLALLLSNSLLNCLHCSKCLFVLYACGQVFSTFTHIHTNTRFLLSFNCVSCTRGRLLSVRLCCLSVCRNIYECVCVFYLQPHNVISFIYSAGILRDLHY